MLSDKAQNCLKELVSDLICTKKNEFFPACFRISYSVLDELEYEDYIERVNDIRGMIKLTKRGYYAAQK